MFCTKCGAQLPEDAEFCTKCGTKLKGAAGAVNQIPVQQEAASAVTPQAASEQTVDGQAMPTQKAVNNNRNKIAKPLIIAALFLCVVVAVWYSKSDVRQNLLMDTGAKAVSEQDFAKALNCYQKMLKLDNQNEDIYLFGADIYLAQDRWEEAIQVIEQGIAITGSERLENRLGYICENVVVVSAVRTHEYGEDEFRLEYDGWGNLINAYCKFHDDGVPLGVKLEHDNKGNLIKWVDYTDKNGNGIVEDWECEDGYKEFEYDSRGNLIKRINYDDDGSISSWYECEYDNRGNQIKMIHYDSDRRINYGFESEYDNRGNLIKRINYDDDGSISSWNEWEYDSRGNQIKEISYNDDGSIGFWNEWEYDSRGNQIKEIRYYDEGSIRSWDEYEYDSRGNLIKEISYNDDGSISSWCEYDSRGYSIKHVCYGEAGKVTHKYERELNAAGIPVKENDYEYVQDEDGKETESLSESTWEYQLTYAGDILCCSNITPLSGGIKFVQNGSSEENVFLSMKRKPSNLSPGSLELYYEVLAEGGIEEYCREIRQNMLGDYYNEGELEVIGETAGYYQLANGWYVAKDQPGIVFIEQ